MFRELIPLVAALAAAVIVYVARERRRQRMRIAPPRPNLRMRELSDAPALLEIERAALATDNPRVAFRRAALENALAALYLEAVAGYGFPDTGDMQRVHTRTWQTVREYLRLKYDDAVADDWFDYFMRVAEPYLREKVRLTEEPAFAKIYDELLQDLFADAVRAPQKKSFVPPDLSQS